MRDVYTTGQIGKLCRMSPWSVAKLIDAGEINGYRIPGQGDRRVRRADLVDWLKRSNLPFHPDELDDPTVRCKDVFTTVEVGRLCGVNSRTVCAWIDSGQLKGFRVPGGRDRRVFLQDLLAFLDRSGMPYRPEDLRDGDAIRPVAPPVLLVSPDDMLSEILKALLHVRGQRMVQASNAFQAGQLSERLRPDLAFLDMAIGRGEALLIARELSHTKGRRIVALTEPGESNFASLYAHGVSAWHPRDQLPKALVDLSASFEATPQLEYQP